jgi:hypothetical protein
VVDLAGIVPLTVTRLADDVADQVRRLIISETDFVRRRRVYHHAEKHCRRRGRLVRQATAGGSMTTPIEVEGHTGQVTFDGFFVTIHRKGFRARAIVGKGEKRIPLPSIAAVQWKPAGAMVNGFIQFTVPGGNERRSKFGSQTTDASKDENSVVFTKRQMPDFAKLRAAVEQAMSSAAKGSAAPPPGRSG